jgi:endonuclease/exonuclease/phosphatase family metal-dependent hydrolase
VATQPPSAVASLKVLTVNAHKGFTVFNRRFILPKLREAVRAVGADVVFLQEVHGTHARHARRFRDWPTSSQYEFLADTIWTDFAYGRNSVYPEGDHGNALLSKFPILRHENLDVSIDGAENRGLLHCVLQTPPRPLHAVCVHLGLREAERRRQVAQLCELLHTLPPDAPLVVAGDFNDWRVRANPILENDGALREVFVQTYGGLARSYPAFWPVLRLDRIYVRNVDARAPQVLRRRPWTRLSDHLPLAVELRL